MKTPISFAVLWFSISSAAVCVAQDHSQPADPIARVGVAEGQSKVTLHGVARQREDGTLELPGVQPWGWAAVGESDQPLEELEGLVSLTMCGWTRPATLKIGSGGNRIAFNLKYNANGIDLVHLGDGRLRLSINEWPDSVQNDSSANKLRVGEWTFFAVAYDGTKTSDNVAWYFGDVEEPAALDRRTSYNAGATGDDSGPLAIGNFNTTFGKNDKNRQFRGQLHAIQIFGSKTGAEGAMNVKSIRAIQSDSASRPDFSVAAPADLTLTTPPLESSEQTDPAVAESDVPMPAEGSRPRVIATTDGEIDDRCSMVRFLLYANEWDVEGLIYCSSKYHWVGHNWHGTEWIDQDIDRYASIYDTLSSHAPGYPPPDELRSKIFVGNIDNVSAMDKDTPGSDRIADVLLDSKAGPVYLQAWGGTNTIARALWKIQHEHPEQMAAVSRKAIIYIIYDQDATFRDYIQPNWPDLPVLLSADQFYVIAYDWEHLIPEELHKFYDRPWMERHILNDHGPLCGRYEASARGFRSEGDSPAFMHQIDVGLRSLEHPSYGGWGGRFIPEAKSKRVWRDARDGGDVGKPIWRFSAAFQNDWAARADWCVKQPDDANHPPHPKAAGALDRTVKPGQKITLSAEGSADPDGDDLNYRWWQYNDVDTAQSVLKIENASSKTDASFTVPAEPGRNLHVILEVTDQGEPPLTRYQRLIFSIAE